jgi:hypothetical protein
VIEELQLLFTTFCKEKDQNGGGQSKDGGVKINGGGVKRTKKKIIGVKSNDGGVSRTTTKRILLNQGHHHNVTFAYIFMLLIIRVCFAFVQFPG